MHENLVETEQKRQHNQQDPLFPPGALYRVLVQLLIQSRESEPLEECDVSACQMFMSVAK